MHGFKQSCYVSRVGKVSGIEVSGRVSGMPEMPEMPETINLEIYHAKLAKDA